MKSFITAASSSLVLALSSFAQVVHGGGIHTKQIKNLVTFGDSYTDIVNVGDGGVAWPVYAAGYANLSLFPFAQSGATCSNNLTFRPYPSVFESQLPTYFQEKASLDLSPQETVYTLWIGTNDLGSNALLTGSDKASLVNVTACMVNWVQVLYESGARNFIFQNVSSYHNWLTCTHSMHYDRSSHCKIFRCTPQCPIRTGFGRPLAILQNGVSL